MQQLRCLAVVALAALVAAGCGGGTGTPDTPPSSSQASPPSRTLAVGSGAAPTPTPAATPTVEPPPGTRVLAGPATGSGPGVVATLRAPRQFAVVVACSGTGRFVILVEGRSSLPTRCSPKSEDFVYEPLGEPGQVTVRVDTDSSVRWAVLITTATR